MENTILKLHLNKTRYLRAQTDLNNKRLKTMRGSLEWIRTILLTGNYFGLLKEV
jgi:hypothetical protein